MPKKLTAILVIAMMLISSLTVGATEGKPTFVTNSVTASAGEEVEITIGLKNNPGIASIKLSVVFPEELILNKVTYNFTIIDSYSARLAYEFVGIPGYEITKVIRNNKDITSEFDRVNNKINSIFISS